MGKKRTAFYRSKIQDVTLVKKMDQIAKIVCDYYGVHESAMYSRSRVQKFVKARQVTWYFIRKYLTCSLNDMGTHYERDHTSIIHGLNVISDCMETKSYLYDDIIDIQELIKKSEVNKDVHIDIQVPHGIDWQDIVTDITGKYKSIKYFVHR